MQTITDPRELSRWTQEVRARGESIAFVPTMGFLHEGHLSLMREARKRADHLLVSIFVNPLQFGPNEDLDRYPSDLEGDQRKIQTAGGELLFYPSVKTMYPSGEQTIVRVREITEPLCGASRTTHFQGVTTVVSKLFLQVLL